MWLKFSSFSSCTLMQAPANTKHIVDSMLILWIRDVPQVYIQALLHSASSFAILWAQGQLSYFNVVHISTALSIDDLIMSSLCLMCSHAICQFYTSTAGSAKGSGHVAGRMGSLRFSTWFSVHCLHFCRMLSSRCKVFRNHFIHWLCISINRCCY